MLKLFTDHPAAVGETYWTHLLFAGRFGLHMMTGGAACLLHGLLPFLFTTTGSRTILILHARMQRRQPAHRTVASQGTDPEYAI
jgi:hypothetical protein